MRASPLLLPTSYYMRASPLLLPTSYSLLPTSYFLSRESIANSLPVRKQPNSRDGAGVVLVLVMEDYFVKN